MPAAVSVQPEHLRGFSRLLARQRVYLEELARFTDRSCTHVQGMDEGLLDVVDKALGALGRVHRAMFDRCAERLGEYAHRLDLAATRYRSVDEDLALELGDIFPDAPGWFRGYPAQLGSPHGYRDLQPVSVPLRVPGLPKVDVTDDLRAKKGILGELEKFWGMATGKHRNLVEELLQPLLGDWRRIAWLADCYRVLWDNTYPVAWNIRAATAELAPEWDGAGGREFEASMFRWHMGLGGLADLDKVIDTALGDLHGLYLVVAKVANHAIDKLINTVLKPLKEKIHAHCVCRISLVTRGTKLINTVTQQIARLEKEIHETHRDISRFISRLEQAARDPLQLARDWYRREYDQVTAFEAPQSWNEHVGALRVILLPRP